MKLFREFDFVPHPMLKFLFFVPVVLIVLMAVISGFDRSPDELNHFYAAKYYFGHFLPPVFDDPAIRASYSVFGVSYLNYHWFEYFFAGKFGSLLSLFSIDELLAVRLFGAFMFISLAGWFFFRKAENLIFGCVLLVTPQIWYVFSYANNDAFALFVSMIAAYQVGFPESLFNNFLAQKNLSGGILFGILCGIMLTLKTNYYTFLIFIALWLLFKLPFEARYFKKAALVAALALLVVFFRCGMDFYVNGETNFVGLSYFSYFSGDFEKQPSKLLIVQEEYAEGPYKPSRFETDLMNTDKSMKLKAKGVPFKDVFRVWRWHEFSFRSFVGTYGYMNIFAPDPYYWLMAALYAAFATYLFGSLVYFRKFLDAALGLGSLLVCAFVSSYLSWTYAVQSQGRYLFPIIPITALVVYSNRELFLNFWMNAFVSAAFLLSLYSFVFVGLAGING